MYRIYEIMPGDNIDSVANMFNTTKEELMSINSDLSGRYIIVPNNNISNSDIFDMYIVKSGDNLYTIAKDYNISVDDLALINGVDKNDYIYPNQQMMIPNKDTKIYITKENDTIDTLVNNFNTDYNDLIKKKKKIYLLPDQLIIFKKESFQ